MNTKQFIESVAIAANEGQLRNLKPYSKVIIFNPGEGDHGLHGYKIKDGIKYMFLAVSMPPEAGRKARPSKWRYPYRMLRPYAEANPAKEEGTKNKTRKF